MMTVEPAGGQQRRAPRRAIRSFCVGARPVALDQPRPRSRRALCGGTAPPCTRRTRPMRSRVDRSRRTVSVVTSYSVGEHVHRHPAALGDELGHRLLALLGVHGHRATSCRHVDICVCVVLRPNVLTVKGGGGLTCDHGHQHRCLRSACCAARPSSRASPTAPRCSPAARSPPTPIAALRRRRLRRRRGRARGVRRARSRPSPTASRRKADRASRRGRRGAHRQRRPGARQGPARRGAQAPARGRRPGRLRARRGRAVRRRLHQHGRADGRAGHRPARHRAPAWSRTSSASPSPACPTPDEPSVLVAEDLAPADTAGLDPRLVHRAGHRAGRPDQPHRDHRPPARHPVRGRHGRRDGDRRRHPGAGRRHRRHDRGRARRRGGRRAGSRADRERARALAAWSGPGRAPRTARRSSCSPTSPTASRRAPPAQAPVEGVGLFRTELCFLNRKDEPSVEEQADIYGRGARRRSRRRTAYVVVRTLDAGSDKPVAFATHEGEENPALGVRGLRLSFSNPALLDRQLDAHRRGRRAHRHRDLGDGADGGHRRRGRGLRRAGARAAASRPG